MKEKALFGELALWEAVGLSCGRLQSEWMNECYEQSSEASLSCDRNYVKSAQSRSHKKQNPICTVTLRLNTCVIAPVCVLWRNQHANYRCCYAHSPKYNNQGHHLAEAVCRLSLSAVDRVRSQSGPWTQWHCDTFHSVSFSAVKLNPRCPTHTPTLYDLSNRQRENMYRKEALDSPDPKF